MSDINEIGEILSNIDEQHQYLPGSNINITDYTISGRDWSEEIDNVEQTKQNKLTQAQLDAIALVSSISANKGSSWKTTSEKMGSTGEGIYLGGENEANNENAYVMGSNNTTNNKSVVLGTDNTIDNPQEKDIDIITIGQNNNTDLNNYSITSTTNLEITNIGKDNNVVYDDTQTYAANKQMSLNIGNNNEITNEGINIGKSNTADIFGVTLGQNNSASQASIVVGQGCRGSQASVNVGKSNTTTNVSFAFGESNITQNAACTFGKSNTAESDSMSVGTNNHTYGGSYTLGRNNTAKSGAMAYGESNVSENGSDVVGNNNSAMSGSNILGEGAYAINGSTVIGCCASKTTSALNGSLVLRMKGYEGPTNIVSANNGAAILGGNTTATESSITIGFNNNAKSCSKILGDGNNASEHSIAIGDDGCNAKNYSIAIGKNGSNSDGASISVGLENTNANIGSLAFGRRSVSALSGSIAIGEEGVTAQNGGISIGKNTCYSNSGSIAIGYNTTFASKGSIAIGCYSNSADDGSLTFGQEGIYASNASIVIGRGGASAISDSLIMSNHRGSNAIAVNGSFSIGQNKLAGAATAIGLDNNIVGWSFVAGHYNKVKLNHTASDIDFNNINYLSTLSERNHSYVLGDYNLVDSQIKTSSTTYWEPQINFVVGQNNSARHYNSYIFGSANYTAPVTSYPNYDRNDDGYVLVFGRGNSAMRNYDIAIGYGALASGGENIVIGTSGKPRKTEIWYWDYEKFNNEGKEIPSYNTSAKGYKNIVFNGIAYGISNTVKNDSIIDSYDLNERDINFNVLENNSYLSNSGISNYNLIKNHSLLSGYGKVKDYNIVINNSVLKTSADYVHNNILLNHSYITGNNGHYNNILFNSIVHTTSTSYNCGYFMSTTYDVQNNIVFNSYLRDSCDTISYSMGLYANTELPIVSSTNITDSNFGNNTANNMYNIGANILNSNQIFNIGRNTVKFAQESRLKGNYNKIQFGDELDIFGDINGVERAHNTNIFGDNNLVISSTYSNINGHRNVVKNAGWLKIFGQQNYIHYESKYSEAPENHTNIFNTVFGTRNEIQNASRYNTVQGENNNLYNTNHAFVNGCDNTINGSISAESNKGTFIHGDANTARMNDDYGFQTIFGKNNITSGDLSVAIGGGNKALNHLSIAIGQQLEVTGEHQTVIGKYNIPLPGVSRSNYKVVKVVTGNYSWSTAWSAVEATDPSTGALFVIGNGYCESASLTGDNWQAESLIHRSNAMIVSADGTVSATKFAIPQGNIYELITAMSANIEGMSQAMITMQSTITALEARVAELEGNTENT